MNFKEFLEQEEEKDPYYFKALVPVLHVQPKDIADFYGKTPITLSNFVYDNGKKKAALNTVLLKINDKLKGEKVRVFTPKGNAAIVYTKDKKPIFKKPSKDNLSKTDFPINTQGAINIALQPFGDQQVGTSKLGGTFGAGIV